MKNILFFSGGTALRGIATEISSHENLKMTSLITVFDSGGSSAEIRKHFGILPIGDIRNRLISLIKNFHQEDTKLLSYRFKTENQKEVLKMLKDIVSCNHILIEKIKKAHQKFYINSLKKFLKQIPHNFNLQNASIGNLIFLGNYLETKNIYKTIKNFKELLNLKDDIFPITEEYLDLGANLENGQIIFKQHNITAKETPSLNSKIKDIFILDRKEKYASLEPFLKEIIILSDAIIYPVGSFYTSVLSNFLLKGVSESIKKNNKPKIYIPNTYFDSELNNLPLSFQVNELLNYLKTKNIQDVLTHIILDSEHLYPFDLDLQNIPQNIKIISKKIVFPKNNENYPKLYPKKIVKEILNC